MIPAVIPFTPPQHITLFGPVQVSAHGVAFLIGALVSLTLTKRRTDSKYHRSIEDAIPFMLLGAVLGARGLFFLQRPDLWIEPWKLFAFWEGGLVSYGGMVGALLAFYAYLRKNRLPVAEICDALAPAALVGWGIGRFGCFLSWYDEWGTPSDLPWAFMVQGVSRHPVMLYLSLSLITAGLLLLRRPTKGPFHLTGLCLVTYATLRSVLDTWRDYDPDFMVWTSRGACLLIALWGIALIKRSSRPLIEKNPDSGVEMHSPSGDDVG